MNRREIEKYAETVKQEDSGIRGNTASESVNNIDAVEDKSGSTFISRPVIRINDLARKEHAKWKASRNRRTVIDPFGVADLIITPPEVLPNEIVTVSFNATNNSDVYSMYSISLKINGEVVAAEVMKLPPGVSMPLYFTVKRNLPGEYIVKVNHLVGKFHVIGSSLEKPIEDTGDAEADTFGSGDRFEPGLSEIDAYLKQKRALDKKAAAQTTGLQYGVDKTAAIIEQGLDKVGDGLVFPIVKLVDGIKNLLKAVRR